MEVILKSSLFEVNDFHCNFGNKPIRKLLNLSTEINSVYLRKQNDRAVELLNHNFSICF